jgi:hypothetical protein
MFLNYTMPHFALRSEADIHNSLHVQSQLMVESISELQRKVNFLTWLEFATRCKNGCVHAKLSFCADTCCIIAGEVTAGGEQGSAKGGRFRLLKPIVASMHHLAICFSMTQVN